MGVIQNGWQTMFVIESTTRQVVPLMEEIAVIPQPRVWTVMAEPEVKMAVNVRRKEQRFVWKLIQHCLSQCVSFVYLEIIL